jgi:hypothetical protein
MAEMVRYEIEGKHFAVGSALDLVNTIHALTDRTRKLEAITKAQTEPVGADEAVTAHLNLYKQPHPIVARRDKDDDQGLRRSDQQ